MELRAPGRRRAAALAVLLLALAALLGLPGELRLPAPAAQPDSAPSAPEPGPPPERTPPQEQPAPGRAALSAGSVPVGTARYAVPDGAFAVAPDGDDAAAGDPAAPWRTVAHAVAAAPDGATIVLQGGTYHEGVVLPEGKRLTLQAAPGEEVWLDGSREVAGWVADGGIWRADGWTVEFDRSPTYTRGAPDNTEPGFTFLDPEHPLAAHPDQVFVDGVAQVQVARPADVVPGTFAVDYATDRLWLGTDPAGRSVRASDLSIGLTIEGAGSTVRGLGIRRYAPSVPDKGALLVLARGATVVDVVVQDSATQGVYVGGRYRGEDVTLRRLTAERNGLIGIESSYADRLLVEAVRATGNNTERFNTAPVSGGLKLTRARGVTVRDSVFADNLGTGLWLDESVYDATLTGNDVLRNTGNGLVLEISARAVIADNHVAGSGLTGLKINNSSDVEVWNNTVLDNAGRTVWVVQDERLAADVDVPGHDPRQPLPDPTVTWVLGPVRLGDNVLGGTTGATCVLCVQDRALGRTAEEIGVTARGNLYLAAAPGAPPELVTWPGAGAFGSIADFRAATGQEETGGQLAARLAVDADHRLTPPMAALQARVAVPLPDGVAPALGRPAGGAELGARL
ncbi:right-handed parallel beta-helix repeat-containing protein [Blastococcus sp. SYSU D00820]